MSTMLDLIREMAEDGKAVLIIEHNLDLVRKLAHQVFVMDTGQIVASGSPSAVFSDAKVKTTGFRFNE
jgi:ABC-type branched-subunit amino acid transport system ATPase component